MVASVASVASVVGVVGVARGQPRCQPYPAWSDWPARRSARASRADGDRHTGTGKGDQHPWRSHLVITELGTEHW